MVSYRALIVVQALLNEGVYENQQLVYNTKGLSSHEAARGHATPT